MEEITDEQILELCDRAVPTELWKKAFKIYNKSNKPLSMGCPPCYWKVLKFILKQRLYESSVK